MKTLLTILLIIIVAQISFAQTAQKKKSKNIFDGLRLGVSASQRINRFNKKPIFSISLRKQIPVNKRFSYIAGISFPVNTTSRYPTVVGGISIKICC